MLERYDVRGRWLGNNESQQLELVADFVAGLLTTVDPAGAETRRSPEEFQSTTGETGWQVLDRVLLPPCVRMLRYGAIRESLIGTYSVARYGFSETRAWDGRADYIVNTGEGSCGVVRFTDCDGLVAAMIHYDPWREYDLPAAIRSVPPPMQSVATSVCELPFLARSEDETAITALFWGENDTIQGSEPWTKLYEFGAENLRFELLGDDQWTVEAAEHHEAPKGLLALVAQIAKRTFTEPRTSHITSTELRALVPKNAPKRSDALGLLVEMGYEMPD